VSVPRIYRLCSAAELAGFEAHAVQVLQAWARQWTGEAGAPALDCRVVAPLATDEVVQGRWCCAEGVHGSVWAAPEGAAAMAGLLFGEPLIAGEVALEAGRRALAALLQPLAGAAPTSGHAAPAHFAQAGRALLQLTLGEPSALRLLVELPETQRAAAARRPVPLGSARTAIGQQPVTLEVRLGEAEIALGALATLAVGDVLVLDRRLDEGVELRLDEQRLPCAAYLGSVDGRIAVEVTRR
jgi:flagellar motor switch/type III secretory pathway protein FliN